MGQVPIPSPAADLEKGAVVFWVPWGGTGTPEPTGPTLPIRFFVFSPPVLPAPGRFSPRGLACERLLAGEFQRLMQHFLAAFGEKVYFLLTEQALLSCSLLYPQSTTISSQAPKYAHTAEQTGCCLLSGMDLHHVPPTCPLQGSVYRSPGCSVCVSLVGCVVICQLGHGFLRAGPSLVLVVTGLVPYT